MKPIAGRSRLLASCAIAASLVAAGRALPAQAQAFQGSPVVVSGGATIFSSPGVDTIDVSTPQAVIDWMPFDTSSPTIDFLPSGTQAEYIGAPGLADFTVLNRILPASPNQVVALNGSVLSRLQDSFENEMPGGSVWFYTPGGILVGATATFDVGGLLLTTADPIRDGFGNFLFGNTAQLRAAPGSLSGITIAPGARIDALPEDSYLAVVAPRITQSGTATVNGGVAYVAAEAVDLTINRGTFDIGVVAGTAANGSALVHDGVTTGPSSTDASDPHRIYMVAVPQNDAITLLVSGRAGFDPATVAGVENGVVVLSAGRSVFSDTTNSTPQGAAEADIRITGGDFTSRLVADASGSTKAASELANLNFAGDVILSANRTAELRAMTGTLMVGGNATVQSAVGDRTAGTAAIVADAGATLNIFGDAGVVADGGDDFRFNILGGGNGFGGIARIASAGTIQIGGNALVSAQGRALFTTTGDGFDAFGGNAAILAMPGGRIDIALGTQVSANAFGGGSDSGASGDTLGGAAAIKADGGMIGIGGASIIEAQAFSSTNITAGGSATGGQASLAADNGGTVSFSGPLDISARAIAAASVGIGGVGTGGLAEIRTNGGAITAFAPVLIDASGFGGFGLPVTAGPGGVGSAGTGGNVAIVNSGGAMNLATVNAFASGVGGSGGDGDTGGAGAIGRGGSILLQAIGGPISGGDFFLTAEGQGGFGGFASIGSGGSGGDGFGGVVDILAGSGGGFVGARLQALAGARGGYGGDGGNAARGGAGGVGGDAAGGLVRLTGFIGFGETHLSAFAFGGNGGFGGQGSDPGDSGGIGGDGGLAAGGIVKAGAFDGDMAVGLFSADVFTRGGNGGFGGLGAPDTAGVSIIARGGAGGDGAGGDVSIVSGSDPANPSPTTIGNFIAIAADIHAMTEGGFGNGGAGGDAIAGSATILVNGGAASLADFGRISTRAAGGFGDVGGNALGGSSLIMVTGGTLDLAPIQFVEADAFGGDGIVAGSATGGSATIDVSGGALMADELIVTAAATGAYSPNAAGAATGGTSLVRTSGGTLTANRLVISATAFGGGLISSPSMSLSTGPSTSPSSGGSSARGGDAFGGSARLEALGGGVSVAGEIQVISSAHAGAGAGIGGGDAFGGSSAILVNAGAALNGGLTLNSALAAGGDAVGGGVGGNAVGGNASIAISGGVTNFASAQVDALAHGGWGGLGGAGGQATGGTAIASFSGGQFTTGNLGIVAHANGGFGGMGVTGSIGGTGGDATGGQALLALSGNAIVDAGSAFVSAGAFGGFGGMGGAGPAGGFGGAGGAGGTAVGGNATLIATGGSLISGSATIDAFGHGGDGGLGGAGSDPGNSGGIGGNGAAGTAGAAKVEAVGGALSFASLGMQAGGYGGYGGPGGNGATNPDGSVTTAAGGTAATGRGGTATIRVADDAANGTVGKLQGGDTFMMASGLGGFDATSGMPVGGFVGGLLVTAEGAAAGGGSLDFTSLVADARGMVSSPSPTFVLNSASQVVTIGQMLDASIDGDALVKTGVGARFDLPGSMLLIASGSITVDSLDSVPAVAVDGGDLVFSAGGDIVFKPTAFVRAATRLQAFANGSLTANRLASDGSLGLHANNALTVTSVSALGDVDLFADNALNAGSVSAGGSAFIGSNNGGVTLGDVTAAEAFLHSAADTRFTSIAATGDVAIAAMGGDILGGTIDAGGNAFLFASNRVDAGGTTVGGALYVANTSMLSTTGPTGPTGTLVDFLALPPVATGGDVRFTGGIDADSVIINSGAALSLNGLAARTDLFLTAGAGDLILGAQSVTGSIGLTAAAGNLTTGGLTSGLDASLFASGAITATGAFNVGGTFDVHGASVAIDAAGSLSIDAVNAASGAGSIASDGNLDVGTASAATGLALTSRSGTLRAGKLGSGADVNISAAGLATLDGPVDGANIAIASGDITVNSAALVTASTSLTLAGTGSARMTIGGTGSVSGYSLDAAEFARLSTPKLTLSASGDIELPDLTIAGSAAAAPVLTGPSATLRIQTPGSIKVTGKLLLTDAGAADRIELAATQRLSVSTPTGGIAIKTQSGALAGTLALKSDNIVIASDAAAADLATAPDLAARKARLATNDGTASASGYLEAAAISLAAGRTLHVQNSGTATDLSGLTVGAGGLSVSATGSQRTEMILYGRGANPDGSFVTGEAFIPTVTRSSGFDGGSTINGCFLIGSCLGAPPEPVQQAIAATVDTVVAVIASAQESDSGAGGESAGGAPSSSQSVTRAPNIVLGELLDLETFRMQGPIEGPVTGAGNDDPWSEAAPAPPSAE